MTTKKKAKKAAPEKPMSKVKEEILEQVRLLSAGKISTAFPLVQLGKELLRQEAGTQASESDF